MASFSSGLSRWQVVDNVVRIGETLLDLIDSGFSIKDRISNYIQGYRGLAITRFTLMTGPPRRLAFDRPIYPDLMPPDSRSSLCFDWLKAHANVVGHAGSCKVIASIKNNGSKTESVNQIIVDRKRDEDVRVESSYRLIPQGSVPNNNWHFLCNLDSNSPYMRTYGYCGPKLMPFGEQNYFECGRIEIEPGHTADIVICIGAKDYAYRCSVRFRAEGSDGQPYFLEPEHSFDMTVIPMNMIPFEQRMQSNYSPFPPHAFLESEDWQCYETEDGFLL